MFNCSSCGYQSIKWLGKCPLCDGWETFVEQSNSGVITARPKASVKQLKDIDKAHSKRITVGIDEFDRILGGGLVEGEVILLGGEPGIGKSTLLLEVGSMLCAKGKTLYVSAEESPQQIALRASRLKNSSDSLHLLGEDDLTEVLKAIQEHEFKFIIIDSIQVVRHPSCDGPKGSVSQIRGCADYLTQIAKATGIIVFIVGHVTKEGALAGPKLLEHLVDCVLYFEGENICGYRILRASKNRFGPTGDIAVFEMTSVGLKEVKKINDIFLPHKGQLFPGSTVACVMQGMRPVPIELQSLVTRGTFGMVRRRSLGYDYNRLLLLTAIIEKRLKVALSSEDVFLNVAGGIKIDDPAADFAAAVAIVSSYKEENVPQGSLFLGEVGLSGELRRVSHINLRISSAARANFSDFYIPESNISEVQKGSNLSVKGFRSMKEAMETLFP
ncbi:MAG: DNA repair protein RadA [Candidatus Omnitrophota bacterium]